MIHVRDLISYDNVAGSENLPIKLPGQTRITLTDTGSLISSNSNVRKQHRSYSSGYASPLEVSVIPQHLPDAQRGFDLDLERHFGFAKFAVGKIGG
ncbi:MAG: hypothetical protein FJZ86_13090 [Chloroflexi bacterium]|nr:hypothetical protein [Chloroflexota bacterium]